MNSPVQSSPAHIPDVCCVLHMPLSAQMMIAQASNYTADAARRQAAAEAQWTAMSRQMSEQMATVMQSVLVCTNAICHTNSWYSTSASPCKPCSCPKRNERLTYA